MIRKLLLTALFVFALVRPALATPGANQLVSWTDLCAAARGVVLIR